MYSLNNEVPTTYTIGDIANISNLLEFGWYIVFWFLTPENDSMVNRRLGKYFMISFDIDEDMCVKTLTDKGNVIHHTFFYPVSDEKQRSS